jgi:protein-S-isoprenylcysteine O-methyltransferase Ste14
MAIFPVDESPAPIAVRISWILFILAGVLLLLAAVPLWPSLTVRPEPKEGPFITRGIYRWVRHPMYTAVLLLGMGLYLSKPHLVMMIFLLGLMYVMFSKATYEDAFLRSKWSSAADYQRRVGMFFPKFRSK